MLMTCVADVIMSCDADILTSLFRVSNFVVVVVSSLGIVPVRVSDCRKPGNDHIEQQRTQIIERSIAQDRYLERVTAHGRLNISVLCSVFSLLPVTPWLTNNCPPQYEERNVVNRFQGWVRISKNRVAWLYRQDKVSSVASAVTHWQRRRRRWWWWWWWWSIDDGITMMILNDASLSYIDASDDIFVFRRQ